MCIAMEEGEEGWILQAHTHLPSSVYKMLPIFIIDWGEYHRIHEKNTVRILVVVGWWLQFQGYSESTLGFSLYILQEFSKVPNLFGSYGSELWRALANGTLDSYIDKVWSINWESEAAHFKFKFYFKVPNFPHCYLIIFAEINFIIHSCKLHPFLLLQTALMLIKRSR